MAAGRPSKYSPAIAEKICKGLALGDALVDVCKKPGMPHPCTVWGWRNNIPEFSEMYARAREQQADTLADEVTRLHKSGLSPSVMRIRLDALRWFAGKVRPREWGDGRAVDAAQSGADALTSLLAKAIGDKDGGVGPNDES